MTVFEFLDLRFQYEELVRNLRIPADKKAGTINNIEWFLKLSQKKRGKNDNFRKATNIAQKIVSSTQCDSIP